MVFLTYQIDTSEQTFLMVQNILTYQFCCRGEGGKTHFSLPLQLEKSHFREIIPGPSTSTRLTATNFKDRNKIENILMMHNFQENMIM